MHRNFSDALTDAGYVTDITYPETFFRELSPVWLNYVAALGQVPPPDLGRPFTYLELGCGRGDYHMQFLRYEEVPAHIAQKLVEAAKKEGEAVPA